MSKSSRRSAPVFGSTAAVLDGPETPVDEQEAPETPETTESEPLEAAEGQPEAPEGHGPSLEDSKGAADAAANESVIDPSGPRAAQADKLTTQVNQALQPEEITAKMSVEAELKTFLGETVVPLPDGSVRATVVIDADKVEVLRAWSEGAGESFEDYLKTVLDMALEAVINGGSIAG